MHERIRAELDRQAPPESRAAEIYWADRLNEVIANLMVRDLERWLEERS